MLFLSKFINTSFKFILTRCLARKWHETSRKRTSQDVFCKMSRDVLQISHGKGLRTFAVKKYENNFFLLDSFKNSNWRDCKRDFYRKIWLCFRKFLFDWNRFCLVLKLYRCLQSILLHWKLKKIKEN